MNTRADIRFPADQLRPYIKALLTAMLNGVQWENDRARMGALSKEICEVSDSHGLRPRSTPLAATVSDCAPCLEAGGVEVTRGRPMQDTEPGGVAVPASACVVLADIQRIKQRMIEIEGKGFKYIVNTTFSENLGQAGRADMSCHWEDTDAAVQEMYSNVSERPSEASEQISTLFSLSAHSFAAAAAAFS